MSWTITLEVSTAGPWVKESAFGFGLVAAERFPTPKAIMLKAIEEDMRTTASIFLMVSRFSWGVEYFTFCSKNCYTVVNSFLNRARRAWQSPKVE